MILEIEEYEFIIFNLKFLKIKYIKTEPYFHPF